jgi:hypothetical protein
MSQATLFFPFRQGQVEGETPEKVNETYTKLKPNQTTQ